MTHDVACFLSVSDVILSLFANRLSPEKVFSPLRQCRRESILFPSLMLSPKKVFSRLRQCRPRKYSLPFAKVA